MQVAAALDSLSVDDIAAFIRSQPGFDAATFDPDMFVASLDQATIEAMLAPILAAEERAMFNKFWDIFPDDGPVARHLYPRHMEHFEAGKDFMERCLMAANRCGKTVAGAWEVASHLTGIYRDWWPGRRFTRPISVWAAGDTNETTRDIIQKELFGKVAWKEGRKTFDGSGYVPREHIGAVTWKSGVPDLADTVSIRHRTGRWSVLGLKSYDQGRRVFQGTAKDVIWLDEECPADVYEECLIRLATTRGMLITTFTPLRGMTDVVMSFQSEDMRLSPR
jgi:phage terminase large subunit-like protein